MSLQINYYVAPNDQFVVYDPNKKTNKTVSYSTLISKIRADVSTYNTGGTVTSISTSSPLTGGVITTAGTIGITQSGAVSDGYLSSADWNTFNNKTSNTGTVTSVGATITGSAMAIANSPITTSGSLDFSFGGTAAEYISGEGNLITFPAIPQGDITAVVAGTGLTGGGTSGSVTLSIDSSVVTLSGTQALTNKSGNISQWTNDSGYTTNVGDITAVTATSPITGGGTSGDVTVGIQVASGSQAGALSSTDWTTFNNKQDSGSYITSLTGEATATGPGAASTTLNNASVTGKVLSGVNITGGTVVATDSILTAFGKVQNQINGILSGSSYQGTWNAATNTPTLTSGSGTQGNYYIVSVDGTTNLDGITDWFVGDWAIFGGTAWQQVDNTDAVVSVNGQTGAVSLTTDNIPEGAVNLYFTNARSRASLSFAAGSGAYNSTTGVITIPTNTSQLTNGSNFITLGSLSGTAPIVYNNSTGAISITQSGAAASGYLSSTDWNTFNGKTANTGTVTSVGGTGTVSGLTLTGTVTTSGSLTLGGTLVLTSGQITAGLGYTPYNATNPSGYTTNTGTVTSVGVSHAGDAFTAGSAVTTAGTLAITMAGTTAQYINGVGNLITFPNIPQGDITAITASAPITGGGTSGDVTIGITQSATAADGYLSSTDWNTFNNKQNALTNPVTGTGTTNYVPKWTSGSAIGNSVIYDDGTNVGIGTTAPTELLHLKSTGPARLLIEADTDNVTESDNAQIILKQDGSLVIGRLGYQTSTNSLEVWNQYAENVIFGTSNTERMRILSGGNVGIGTTSPSSRLHILGTGNAYGLTLDRGGSIGNLNVSINDTLSKFSHTEDAGDAANGHGGFAFTSNAANINSNELFYVSNLAGTKFLINSSGNVGIGTTSPSYPLEISSNTSTSFVYQRTGVSANKWGFHSDNDATYWQNVTSGNLLFTLQNGGNVGIGTTSPDAKLNISTSTAWGTAINEVLTFDNSGSGGNTSNPHSLGRIRWNTNGAIGAAIDVIRDVPGSGNNIDLSFSTNLGGSNTTLAERMRINYNGAIQFNNYDSTNNTGTPTYLLGTDASGNIVKTNTVPGSGAGPYLPLAGGTLTGALTINSTTPLVFTGNGNNGTYTQTAIYANQNNTSGATTNGIFIERGRLTDGAGAEVRNFIIGARGGQIQWQLNGSGDSFQTGGAIISGNVGIGTTAPGGKLQITSPDVGSVRSYTTSNGFGLIFDQYYSAASEPGASYTRTADIVASTGDVSSSQIRFLTKPASANPAVAMLISGNGNVGIGTTSPDAKLDVEGGDIKVTYNSGYNLQLSDNGGLGKIYANGDSSALAFGATVAGGSTATERMRIDGITGNVGIGTTSPSARLTVQTAADAQAINIIGRSDGLGYLQFFGSNGTTLNGSINGATTGLGFNTSSGQKMTILSGGNVGIGTTSPETALEVYGDTANIQVTNTAETDAGIVFKDAQAGTGQKAAIKFNSSDEKLKFFVNDEAAERMVIDTAGNVGIGTTSPDYPLDVVGNIRTQKDMLVGGDTYADGRIYVRLANDTTKIFISSNSDSYFNAGNVGIGTTAPMGPLEVYKANTGGLGGHIILNNNGMVVGNETAVLFNDSGVGSVGYVRAAISSSVEGSPFFGDLKFKTGASSYGSLNTRMIVTGAGNVGIGTTSPNGRLQINQGTDLNVAINTTTNDSVTVSRISSLNNAATASMPLVINGSRLVLTTDTTERMRITSAGNVGIGTTAPVYKFEVSDGTRTAVINPNAAIDGIFIGVTQAKPLAFGTTDTERMRITSGGSLLIGSTTQGYNPQTQGYLFGVKSNTTQAFISIAKSGQTLDSNGMIVGLDSTTGYVWMRENVDITFGTNNSTKVTIAAAGNVGIGTTAPGYKLDVSGSVRLGASGDSSNPPQKTIIAGQSVQDPTGPFYGSYGFLELNATSNYTGGARRYAITNALDANKFAIIRSDSNMATMQMGVSGAVPAGSVADFVITNTGNVGIGTTAPGAKLDVNGTISASGEINSISNNARISLYRSTGTNYFDWSSGQPLYFSTETTAGGSGRSTKMVLLDNGNVGIGTTAPGYKLEVAGTAAFTGSRSVFYDTGGGNFQIKASSGGWAMGYFFQGSSGTFKGGWGAFGVADSLSYLWAGDAYNTPTMVVQGGQGNVGIGTTAPLFNLQVGAGAGTIATTTIRLQNSYLNTNGNFGFNIDAVDNGVSGHDLRFLGRTSPTGAFSELVRIKNSGNVGIGTTAPGAKLDVVSGDAAVLTLQNTENNFGGNQQRIDFYGKWYHGLPDSIIRHGIIAGEHGDSSGYQRGNLKFYTNFDANLVDAMTIRYDGNVGIGTPAPSDKLDITDGKLRFTNTSSGRSSTIGMDDNFNFYIKNTPLGNLYIGNGTTTHVTGAFNAGGGSVVIQTSGNVGIGTTAPLGGKLHLYNSTGIFEGPSSGASVINSNTFGIQVGPTHNRISTANTYYPGIAFNHLLNLDGNAYYNVAPQGWIGLRLVDTPGSERSSLVFATKQGTGTSNAGTDIPTERMCITPFGNVGIGTTVPAYALDVSGTIRATGDVIAYSDARVKENVETIPNAIDKVKAMRGVGYNKIGEQRRSTGVIAQEILEVLPEVVHQDENGMYSVAYGNIVGVLIEAIKEQQKQIDELKAKLK